MDRLTTDNPRDNLSAMLNFAYAKDRRVVLSFAAGEDNIDLAEYISLQALRNGCDVSTEDVMEGGCMECDCPVAILNVVAIQAAELRGRLKMIEDILGDTYDLDRLRELVTADREGRLNVHPPCKVGDTIYILISTFSSGLQTTEATITGFRKGTHKQYVTYRWNIGRLRFDSSAPVDEMGKVWFLSLEEAEAALAKMKEGTE